MPSIPDLPGKGLIEGTTRRARVAAGMAGAGALAATGLVAKRVLGHRGDAKAEADPIAETPTAPPGAEEKPVPKAKPAKPAAPAKPKAPKAKSAKPKAAKAKPAKPKAAKAKAPAKAKSAPKPKAEPGNISTDREHPHRALNNPVVDPDETEYPDPFEKRPDPRDPVDPDGAPFGEEPHPQVGSESTSEPPPSQDPAVERGGKPPKRDKLDD